MHKKVKAFLLSIVFVYISASSLYSQLYTLENSYLKREISVDQQKLATVKITNKLTGQDFNIESEEFSVKFQEGGLLTNNNFLVTDVDEQTLEDGGKRLIIYMDNSSQGLELIANYELLGADFYTRKWILIKNVSDSTLLLEVVEPERMRIVGAELEYSGFGAQGMGDFISQTVNQDHYMANNYNQFDFEIKVKYKDWPNECPLGQPVIISDFFMGLEYPAAYNCVYNQEYIFLRHYPGCNLESNQDFTSRKVVIGVGEDGDIRSRFIEYIVR
ncbi:MAG: hypothetical protein ABIA63_10045, partial [bacterium]